MSSLTDVVHGLEKAEVEGEPALGNTSMRTEPGTQETPNAFYRVDVDFVDAISIGIAGELTITVIHGDVCVSPGRQAMINAVLVGIYRTPRTDRT